MKKLILSFLLLAAFFPLPGKSQQNCGLSVQGIVTSASCSGGMDGAIRLQVSGGAKPYTFFWDSGQDVKDITQLIAGTYVVTVRDKEGCTSKKEFRVDAKKTEALQLLVDQVSAGKGEKTLRVTFGNGEKPNGIYIKRNSDGVMAPFISYTGQALSSGLYTLEALNEAGCGALVRVKIEGN